MEIINGVGFKDGAIYVRWPDGDNQVDGRAVFILYPDTGGTTVLYLDDEPEIEEYLNRLEVPTTPGTFIRSVKTTYGHEYPAAVLSKDGKWRVAVNDSLAFLYPEQITDWEV